MSEPRILTERRGHVLLIGLNRPEKRNAADFELLTGLAEAYGELERDPDIRAGLVYAVGDHFTGGLDLADVGPRVGPDGLSFVSDTGVDPWGVSGRQRTKPVVVAVQGICLTLGIELMLAADVAIAARSTRFGQIEVARGILPFGGATIRFPRTAGWGNAMRYLLTGDMFDADEAYRIGLVQEVVDDGEQFDTALAIAERIAAQAPLAVQATLASAFTAVREGDAAAEARLQPTLARLAASEDARIGMQAFLSRTPAEFVGR
ncbi:crotonase/enoyl-CoA hydratase family protein [Leifsonia shinshuensis]|uniref:crotonase/enoyl-CoA hydratase family protein n=1 Tax=Leifsonia shinshuensis TaxID=150026 RepID=UPI001F507D6A|nr:crotonase/enoyl-CoA hydratase family protein [Leifsonia shinshuensis]MCI0158500.1 crotonase/enoyl-CoA hydratase family protein [Leifsonia shinshuensis]